MKVMVLVKATKESEAEDRKIDPAMMEAMGRFNDALRRAGIFIAADGLKSTRHVKRVRFSGSERTVTDGPFLHPEEQVAGFWLWQVRSLEEAVEWVRRCPNPMPGGCDIEIRPFHELEYLGGQPPTGQARRTARN